MASRIMLWDSITRLYYGTMLPGYIRGLYVGIRLWDYIEDSYYGIILQDYITHYFTESCCGIIFLDSINELHTRIKLQELITG